MLHRGRSLEPIESGSFGRLVEILTEEKPQQPREDARLEIRKVLLAHFVGEAKRLTPEDEALLGWWIGFLMERLETSIGTIHSTREIDPRFIDVFILRK
jgi:hypothetical protein